MFLSRNLHSSHKLYTNSQIYSIKFKYSEISLHIIENSYVNSITDQESKFGNELFMFFTKLIRVNFLHCINKIKI